MPLGTPMDVNLCYGVTPIEQRERYSRGARPDPQGLEVQGDFRVERQVLPVADGESVAAADPAAASARLDSRHRQHSAPCDFAAKHDHCYCFLSYFGYKTRASARGRISGRSCQKTGAISIRIAPGFLQLVGVSETDAQAEKDYAKHIRVLLSTSACTCAWNGLAIPGTSGLSSSLVDSAMNATRRMAN